MNPLVSLIMPSAKGQYTKILHLNKDGVAWRLEKLTYKS
jgi:hypothetical protein